MRCHTPHWQGNDFVSRGTILPEAHPKVIGIYFKPFITPAADAAVEVPAEEPKKRGGRPRLPRDADGNIIREEGQE
jgi:hypothetical protein